MDGTPTKMPPLTARHAFGTPAGGPSLTNALGSQTERGTIRSGASLPGSVVLPSRLRPTSGAPVGSITGGSSIARSRRNPVQASQASLFRADPVPAIYAEEVAASMEVVKVRAVGLGSRFSVCRADCHLPPLHRMLRFHTGDFCVRIW